MEEEIKAIQNGRPEELLLDHRGGVFNPIGNWVSAEPDEKLFRRYSDIVAIRIVSIS